MIQSRILLNLSLSLFCILASSYSLAETRVPASHACGNADSAPAGPDFRTFRALATTAVDSQPAPTAPTTQPQPGVQHASHNSPSENVRRSPAASRIPAAIVTDSDVATIRLVSQTEPAAVPSRFPVPEQDPQPIAKQAQPQDLLSRLTAKASEETNQQSQGNTSKAICAASNAPQLAIEAEPFSALSENESRGVPKNWDISTRRAKVIHEVGNGSIELTAEAPRSFAPTPNPIDLNGGSGKIGLASASVPVEDVESDSSTDVPFWVQPSLLGKIENGLEASQQKPVEAAVAKSNVIAEFRIEGQEIQQLVKPQSNVVIPAPKTTDAVAVDEKQTAKSTESWAKMPVPGRPEDKVAEAEEPDSKLEPRRWAGLFVPQTEDVDSKSKYAQVSFDAPVELSTVPADNLLAQATPRPGVRRRMRLNFLDDPQEAAEDPTRDAIKSLLDSEEDKKDDESSSLLDDLEDDPDDYRERYRYAFEDVIEPKPIKKTPRNYTATLKDIFADEEPNPAIEQAFCGLMWSCAGGKCMSTSDRLKRNMRRNYALFQSPCDTPVCRPMEGFEERVRGMMQTVPAANAPALSPVPTVPAQAPIYGLPRM